MVGWSQAGGIDSIFGFVLAYELFVELHWKYAVIPNQISCTIRKILLSMGIQSGVELNKGNTFY